MHLERAVGRSSAEAVGDSMSGGRTSPGIALAFIRQLATKYGSYGFQLANLHTFHSIPQPNELMEEQR